MFSVALHFVCIMAKIVLRLLALVMIILKIMRDLVREVIIIIKAFIRLVEPEEIIDSSNSNFTEVASIITLPQTSDPNDTAGPSPTDRTSQSIVEPAEAKEIIDSSIVNVSNSETADRVETVRPVKVCKEKIIGIFNTLNNRNIHITCIEVSKLINETEKKCLPWLARHIVMKLIGVGSKQHGMYIKFLNSLKNGELSELITLETEEVITVLMSEDGDRVSPTCRKILNSLGGFYGLMTLAKNKPIGSTFGELTTLLVKAYKGEENKLMNTLPIVTRILKSCAKSNMYNPTSPWTLEVLKCLAELHRQPNLGLNLQLEIERLFKLLNIELKDVNPEAKYFIGSA